MLKQQKLSKSQISILDVSKTTGECEIAFKQYFISLYKTSVYTYLTQFLKILPNSL